VTTYYDFFYKISFNSEKSNKLTANMRIIIIQVQETLKNLDSIAKFIYYVEISNKSLIESITKIEKTIDESLWFL